MMPARASGKRRRIVVAMDSNAESLAGLRRAAALAAELRIELAGLFLEDVDLLRMSELPGHEISLASGTPTATSRTGMERQMRRRAAAARREVKRLAQTFSLSWSFEIRRAALDNALRDAAKADELVCCALAPLPLPRAAAKGGYPHGPARRPRPVLALFEGGDCGAQVLELAARAAHINQQPLEVLVPAQTGAASEKAVAEASRHLAGAEATAPATATVRRLPLSQRALLAALAMARGQLLFLDATGAAAADRLAAIRAAAKCDLLLVSPR